MKIVTNKKAFKPYTEAISVPRDAEDPVVTVIARDGQVNAVITHPQFTLSFPVVHENVEAEGAASWPFSLFKKAVESTKAKLPLIVTKDRFIQEEETFLQEAKPFASLSGSILPNLELKADALAPFFAPLTLFPQKDPLHRWRGQVSFEKRAEGLYLTQCNGVHLASLFVGGDFSACTEQAGSLTPFSVSLLERLLPMFGSSLLVESDDAFGFLATNERKELVVRVAESLGGPHLAPPAVPAVCQFHLNPIDKKPFEKVLMERLRAYRDEHNLEYPDIRLRFAVAPSGSEYTVTAQLNHGDREWTSVLETSSPFLHGAPPAVCLPAYETVKALESVNELTALKLNERGASLESIAIGNGVQQVTVFLHGIAA